MLKVTAIQSDLVWENPSENRKYFEARCKELSAEKPDLVILPEMFTTGFSMNTEALAEMMNGETVSWMQDCAKNYNFLLTGSLIIKDGNHYLNRQIMAFPNGEIQYYDKIHLFRMGNEHLAYTAGKERLIIKYKGWRILPQICYDIRFPLWAYNRNDYDLLLYIANFPSPRRKVWDTLLAARAIENQCYVIGCNRIGIDGNNLQYNGGTQAISPKGEIIAKAPNDKNTTLTVNLNMEELMNFREKFPVHLDADYFRIENKI